MPAITEQIDDPNSRLWSYRGGSLNGFSVVAVGSETSAGTITFWLEKASPDSTAMARISITLQIRELAREYVTSIAALADVLLGAR